MAIGEPRLARLGIDLPAHQLDQPEHRLYLLLAAEDADAAHSRYNALIRRLVSFERAADAWPRRRRAPAALHAGGDVGELIARGLIERAELLRLFEAIEPRLYRFPAVDPAALRRAVEAVVGAIPGG
jgi:hypothetical protein